MLDDKRIAIVVAARMGSTRLPGKCLADLGGKPLIEQLLLRLKRARHADALILATTTRNEDTTFDQFSSHATVIHGDENDLIKRHLEATQGFDIIVRVTGDNPFTDPVWVDRALEEHVAAGAALTTTRSISSNGAVISHLPKGLSIDVLTRSSLEKIHQRNDLTSADREHVIPYFFSHSDEFPIHFLPVPERFQRSDICLTVDTPEDLLFVRTIARALPRLTEATLEDIFTLLERHPGWLELNRHVKRKGAR